MEEDIKIVKEKLKTIESLCTDDCINKSVVIEPLKYAIENILGRLEQLEKEKAELERMLRHRIKYSQELEKDLFEGCSNYVVPKSVIEEKIEELEKKIDKMHPASDCVLIEDYENKIEVLKELLGEE